MKDKKKISIIVLSVFAIVAVISVTYAFISQTLTGTKQVVLSAGTLDLVLEEENSITISNALPMYDEVGMIQDPFTFRLVNNGSNTANYKLELVDVTPQTVELKCSELGEITLDSPAGCRETIYPDELRQEALMLCQDWYPDVTTEEECIEANEYDGVYYDSFEEFIDEGIMYNDFEDTRTLVNTYPDNVVEASVWELYDGYIRYGLTRNGENTIGSISDMEYTWKIDDPELRERALEACKNWYSEVTDEASCLETVNDDWGTNYKTFDDFVGEEFWPNGGRRFTLDTGKIGANETINYDLRLWISEYVEDIEYIEDRTFSFKIDVEISQEIVKISFKDELENKVQESTSTFPNFAEISSATNGRGIYKYTEDGEDIYYWRGNIDTVATEENGIGNHVIFGGFCWEMVRTTKTGGIKMIYDGTPVEVDGKQTCSNTGTASQLSSTSAFNSRHQSPAYVGYMYGNTVYEHKTKSKTDTALTTAGILYGYDVEWAYDEEAGKNIYKLKAKDGGSLFSSTGSWSTDRTSVGNGNHYTCFNVEGKCKTVSYVYYTGGSSTAYYIDLTGGTTIEKALEQMYSNEKPSKMKTTLETWFESTNLDEEENLSKLEDVVYCNDRSVTNINHGWSKDGDASKYMYYSSETRRESGTPDLSCNSALNNRDRFTYKDTVNGNGLLNWPVGLLTADEIILAGGQNSSNSDYYLYTGQYYWAFSPCTFSNYGAFGFFVTYNGDLFAEVVNDARGVRPVVSLAAGTTFSKGSGTENAPYIVESQ